MIGLGDLYGDGPSSTESEIIANQNKIIKLLEEKKKTHESKTLDNSRKAITVDGVQYEYATNNEAFLIPIIRREAHKHKKFSHYLVVFTSNNEVKFI